MKKVEFVSNEPSCNCFPIKLEGSSSSITTKNVVNHEESYINQSSRSCHSPSFKNRILPSLKLQSFLPSFPIVSASSGSSNNSSQLFSHVRMEHLLAGVSGGVASTLILHPLDLVKIRFAVNDGLSSRPKYNGLTHAFSSIFHTEGVRGLYRGVTPNVWGAGSAWGLYFLFYNSIKTWWQGGNTKVDLGPRRNMLIAAEAGLLTLFLTNPIWVVKTRLCLQYSNTAPTTLSAGESALARIHYTGMMDALQKTYRMEGMRGLYRGFVPGIFGVSHGAIQFMTYEEMKTLYNSYRKMPIDAKLGTSEYLVFAAFSKLIAAATTYPYQVVRARLQDQHRVYSGTMDVIRQTWRYEGIRGFYKGLCPYLLHVTPNIMVVFLIYEKFTNPSS